MLAKKVQESKEKNTKEERMDCILAENICFVSEGKYTSDED